MTRSFNSLLIAPQVLAALAFASSGAQAQSVLYKHSGWTGELGYGFSVQGVGDLDSDGVRDYLVAAYKQGGFVDVFSGATGTLMHHHDGDGCFGMGLADLGDINDDGIPDYAIGAPRLNSDIAPTSGVVYVYSGADHTELYNLQGDKDHARFGLSMHNAGDVTGDGVSDLLVGSWWEDFELLEMGSVDMYNGATGEWLFQVRGTEFAEWFGTDMAGVGDMNGDDVPDFIVGSPRRWYFSENLGPGKVQVFSGTDGSLLRTYNGASPKDYFGTSVAAVPDLDGDGVMEHAVGAPQHSNFGQKTGRVVVYSGATGDVISDQLGGINSRFGNSVSSGDLNGDSVPELIVGACACINIGPDSPFPGRVEVRDALSGGVLGQLEGQPFTGFGYSVGVLDDLNGDGWNEFVIGNHWDDLEGTQTGSSWVGSIRELWLTADRHTLTYGDDNSAALQLRAGAASAGQGYLVAGSSSGTFPGIDIHGVNIPLNYDNLTFSMLTWPNVHWFQNTAGSLDAEGNSSAGLVISTKDLGPGSIGKTFHFAFGTISGHGQILGSSNAIPLTVTF